MVDVFLHKLLKIKYFIDIAQGIEKLCRGRRKTDLKKPRNLADTLANKLI